MRILAIDIGGTGLKAAIVDAYEKLLTERLRVETPRPSPPEVVLDAIAKLVEPLSGYDYIAVGFPGVVRHGKILSAPNLGNDVWQNFDLAGAIEKRLGKPARVLNDADFAGLAAIEGKGVEMVITLGTGFGSALFADGQLGPHLELSQHIFRKGETYNEQLGDATLKKIGKSKWNRRVRRAIETLRVLTNFDKLYIGGGNARKIDFQLDEDVQVISNEYGLAGGAWLWQDKWKTTTQSPAKEK